ncbi:MAG: sigma factor, partial [Bacteroidota bacterium]
MRKFKTEKELVSACLRCKPVAQRALYDRYAQAMYNTVYRYTGNHHDTQDILQNGFTRVFRHLASYDEQKGNLLGWIRRIHVRCALDFLKNKNIVFEDINEVDLTATLHAVDIDHLEAEYIIRFI